MEAIKSIQIYGERCSGTNYLERLLSKNLRNIQIKWDYGWKHFLHGPGVENASQCLFIVIHRNPFDWLRSLHRNPWHAGADLRGIDFSEFIRREWWCVWDGDGDGSIRPGNPIYGTEMMFERCLETGERFTNVMRLRSAKIRDWESLRGKAHNHVFVRYEDLKEDPRAFIDSVSERFGIEKRCSFKDVKGERGSRFRVFRPKTYEPIKMEDLRYIVSELDAQLEANIGYDLNGLAATYGGSSLCM